MLWSSTTPRLLPQLQLHLWKKNNNNRRWDDETLGEFRIVTRRKAAGESGSTGSNCVKTKKELCVKSAAKAFHGERFGRPAKDEKFSNIKKGGSRKTDLAEPVIYETISQQVRHAY
ncbi:hypothetical protein RUM44_000889 [Polyplax serrata]|uniref:Uncharacterized protein n=1 Tax=Polyplax serrata TaxID=468196 RepID=A0ABR1B6C4_POLSC